LGFINLHFDWLISETIHILVDINNPLFGGLVGMAKLVNICLDAANNHMMIKMMRQIRKPSARWPFVLFLLFVCGDWAVVARANDTLTNASDVLALSAKEAVAASRFL